MRTATIYNFLIEANIIAGIAILLMIPVRKYLRKFLGNRAICFAWLLVAVRLLCPLALPNPLINEIVTPYNDQPEAIRPIAAQFRVRLGDALSDASYESIAAIMERDGVTVNEAMSKPEYKFLTNMANGLTFGSLAKKVMLVYAAGMLGVAAWFIIVNVRYQRALRKNRIEPLDGELKAYYEQLCEKYGVKPIPVYFVDPLSSACLVGGVKPYIALPLAATENQARQMLAHELCHYKAGDNLWTLVTLICCVIHWFNPLVWAAAAMSRMDRELKCDDNVTRDMDEEARRLYAGTLIQSVTRRSFPGVPMLVTGMSMTGRKMKARVGGILWGGKRIKALAMAFTVAASLLLVCAFGTAAYGETPAPWENGDEERSYLWNSEGGQSLEDALASENAIPTKEAAIEEAKKLLSSEYWKMDVENGWKWSVTNDSYGIMNRRNYGVSGQKGKDSVMLYMAVDGSGAWYISHEGDPYYLNDYVLEHEYVKKTNLSQEEQDSIKQFCLDFMELAEPGETQYLQEIYINGFMTVNDTLYVQLEAPYNQNSSKTFIVQVKPEMRLIDYWTGNG